MWRATLTGSAKQRSRLEKKLDRRPNDRKTVGELGDLLYDLGQYDDAVPIFERGVELGNESRRMRLRFARLHVALHRIHEAGATPTVEPRSVAGSSTRVASYAIRGRCGTCERQSGSTRPWHMGMGTWA